MLARDLVQEQSRNEKQEPQEAPQPPGVLRNRYALTHDVLLGSIVLEGWPA
jgi:hypothetical protein